MRHLPFHSYRRNVPNAAARLVNVFAEANPKDAKGPYSLLRSPGVKSWQSVGTGPGRGLKVMGNQLYAVSGNALFTVGGSVSNLGSIPGSGLVSMAENGSTLVVGTNPDSYRYNGVNVAQITDPDLPSVQSWGFVDGYFTYVEAGSGRFGCSDLYSTNFDALKFATAEGTPDNLVDHLVDHRQIILFGTQSTEAWWNSDTPNFPFSRISNGFIEIGALGGAAKQDNSVFWVANDLTVRRLVGSTPARISTHAVEEALRGYTSTPRGFAYSLEGHLVYVLKYDEATWAYDATTNEWHERESYPVATWRACSIAVIDGTIYVQDRTTGAVGTLDPDTYSEWGAILRSEWTYPNVYDGNRWLFHSRFEVVCQTGVGLISGQGSDPGIVLEYSDDGGRTWTTAAGRSMGAIGDYKHRVFWNRLGRSRDRVYRCWVSDPIKLSIIDTQLEVEPGTP